MNRIILSLTLLFCVATKAFAQNESSHQDYLKKLNKSYTEYLTNEEEKLNQYIDSIDREYVEYLDSLNRQYAEYLAQEWVHFDLQKPEPPIKNPIRTPPVFNVNTPKPAPNQLPLVTPKPAPVPQPQPAPQPEPPAPPVPVDNYPLKTTFFGTSIALKDIPKLTLRLSGTSEYDIAGYWTALSQLPHYTAWIDEMLRLKNELRLNDWGVYQLLNKLFAVYCPQGSENEQVIFSIFMLNQLGYRAKIGHSGNELVPLIAFQQMVYNATCFTNFTNAGEEAIKYTVVNPEHRNLSAIQTCSMDYGGAKHNINMDMDEMPLFAVNMQTKTLLGKPLQYNKNTTDFYATYPCVDFPVYAEAAIDETLWKSIEEHLTPQLKGLSQEEAINLLLHFVQNAFKYKTDEEQFGYEKFFFAEETLASAFSDCEDRSILFAQLVRRMLKMPVVLVSYPTHLATAVKFNNPATQGDYFTINGAKYLICDPTYINATLGMSMPDLKSVPAEILKLRPLEKEIPAG